MVNSNEMDVGGQRAITWSGPALPITWESARNRKRHKPNIHYVQLYMTCYITAHITMLRTHLSYTYHTHQTLIQMSL